MGLPSDKRAKIDVRVSGRVVEAEVLNADKNNLIKDLPQQAYVEDKLEYVAEKNGFWIIISVFEAIKMVTKG